MLSTIVRSVVAIAGLLIVQGGMAASAAHAATGNEVISANQPEYTLGDTAVIYGVGFAPDVSVIMEVVRSDGSIVTGDGTNTPGTDTIVTDGMGAFTYAYIIEGPPEAYAANVTANARDAASPSTILATTTFIDGTQYLLQGCSKHRGDCTLDTPTNGWAGGSSPMSGWTAGDLKGWFEGDNVPYRLRIGLRDSIPSGGTAFYIMNEHDNLRSGVLGIDSATNFYVGAGPSGSVSPEGKKTKNCTFQATRLVGDNPIAVSKPCIVTGPTYTGIDDDGQGGIDEDPVDGIDNDSDGRIDEDPPRQGGSDKRIQYVWAVLFDQADAGSSSKKWALYWTGHLATGSHNWPGSSLHTNTTATGSQDVPISDVEETFGSGTDLSITKTDAPDPVYVGSTLTYTITVTNNGPTTATGVTVSDALPTTVTYGTAIPSQGTCSMSGGTVTCSLGTLAFPGSATVTITVTPLASAVGTLSNTAIVATATCDPTPGNNTSATATTTVTPSANLSIIKSASPGTVLAGQPLTYTITVGNAGPSAATGVSVSDTLPANVTLVSATSTQGTCSGTATVLCSIGTLANGASATVTIIVTPSAAAVGTLSNTATVSSTIYDPNTGNNSSTTSSAVDPAANLSIIKTAPATVLAGQNLTYTLTVTNFGPSAATGVSVSDPLPANTTYVSGSWTGASSGTCSNGGGTVSCTIGTLNNGASVTVTIVVTPSGAAVGTLSNTASVTSSVTDPNTANNSSTATTTVSAAADLSISKTASAGSVLVGNNLTYTITVTNNGPNTATGVTMTDALPVGVNFVSSTPGSPTCTNGSGTVTCSLGNMANGATSTVTIVISPTSAAVPSITNTASVTSGTADPNTGNNTSPPVTTTVNSLTADLAVNKTVSNGTVYVGQNFTYTITVTNLGPNTATGVSVSDTLPVGVSHVSSTPSQGSCSGTSTVNCTIGILGNGASASVTIVVTATASGTVTNTATVGSGVFDPNSVNNSGSVDKSISGQLDLAITQVAAPSPVLVGQPVTFTITITNNGPGTATGVTVVNTPPTLSHTFNSVTPDQGSCTPPASSAFTCSVGTIAAGNSVAIVLVVTPLAEGMLGNTTAVSGNESESTTVNNLDSAAANVGDVSRLINISTRGFVGTGQDAMVGGFILGGNLPKQLLIRGFGPTLSSFGVTGVLANPILELSWDDDSNPLTAPILVATNDNFGTAVTTCNSPAVCGTPAEIIATGLSANAYAPTNPNRSLDAALLITLPPGAYTVSLAGVSNGTGVGLIDVNDTDGSTQPKLVNISTRGQVLTEDHIMIGGFIIGAGTGNKQVLVRALGPTLFDFGITTGFLANPTIELYWDHDLNPLTTAILLATNDDFEAPVTTCNSPAVCGTPAEIIATGLSANTYAPTNPNRNLDSAILVTLPPGAYTVNLSGVNSVIGVGLVDINEIGN